MNVFMRSETPALRRIGAKVTRREICEFHVPLKFQFLLRDREAHPKRAAAAFAAVFIIGLHLEKVYLAQAETRVSVAGFCRDEIAEGVAPARRSHSSSKSCKASRRKSGTLRSNHCLASPGGRMPCFIRRAAKRGQWNRRCSTDSSQSLDR